jgi:hypothetical protein
MKKVLLLALFSAMITTTAFAQFRWQTNTVIGQELKNLNTANKDTFTVHFNTTVAGSQWAKAKAAANIGKDSVVWRKAQTQRGIQVKGFLNDVTTTAYENGSLKSNNAGGNGNPGRVASVDSLKALLAHSITTGSLGGNVNDSLTRPAACLFDITPTNQAFGMFPGKVKKLEYVFRFDYAGKACPDDITFEMSTYDAGTTSKTATYTLAVYKSSTFSDANKVGNIVNVYTTGSGTKTVSVAAEIGVSPMELSNKAVYVVVKTLGTSNASDVVDGIAHLTLPGNVLSAYDPTVVFDNFYATYASSAWVAPAGIVGNAVLNHNNGSPLVTISTDFTGGSPKSVAADTNYPVKMYFTSIDRLGTIAITEANDGGGHAAGFSFAETGAVKKKNASGNYDTDVTYTYVVDPVTSKFTLTIPAPTAGSVNDTLEITMLANVPLGATRTERLELTNGVRFWYNVSAVGDTGTGLHGSAGSKTIFFGEENQLKGIHVTENVSVYSVNGQLVRTANVAEIQAGINLNKGLYIVKSGNDVHKVLVK